MRLPLMLLKSRSVAVNLIDDALHWRLGHHVDDIYKRVGLGHTNTLGRPFRQPVEFHCLIVKQREYGEPAVWAHAFRPVVISCRRLLGRQEFTPGRGRWPTVLTVDLAVGLPLVTVGRIRGAAARVSLHVLPGEVISLGLGKARARIARRGGPASFRLTRIRVPGSAGLVTPGVVALGAMAGGLVAVPVPVGVTSAIRVPAPGVTRHGALLVAVLALPGILRPATVCPVVGRTVVRTVFIPPVVASLPALHSRPPSV
jgi:hypothetical protein